MTAGPAPRTGRAAGRRLIVAATAATALILLGWLLWPGGSGATVLYAGTDRYAATVSVAEPRVGATDITVTLATRTGAPVGNAAVLVQATMPLMGMATPPISATSTGTGRYDASGVPLMITGPWQLRLTVTGPTGTVEELVVPLTVTG